MSGQLGELVISLAADTARFRSDLGKATKATQDASKEMTAHFDKMGAAVKTTIGLMAGLAGVASLSSLVKGSIDAADNMSKMSQKVGVAIDQLSGMAYAAGLADVSTEQLGKGMGKLAKLMYEAAGDKNGGPAETFKTLGVSVTDAAGKLRGTDDVMMDVAERLAGMKDGAAKTALAMEVFGKAGADLIPLLNGGKQGIREAAEEAKRFGLILTEEAGRQAEEFNDNLTRLKARASGAAITLANDLLPEINKLVDTFAKGGDLANSPFMSGIHSIKAEFLRLAMLADKAGGSLTSMGMMLYGPGSAMGYKPSEERFKRMADLNIMFEERYKDSEKAMQTMANLEVGLDADGNPFKPKAGGSSKGSGIGETGKKNKIRAEAETALAAGKSLAEEYKKQAQELFTSVLEIHDAYAAGIQGEGSSFSLMATQGGDLKTDRYKVTPLSEYKLMTGDNYSIPQQGFDGQAEIDAAKKKADELLKIETDFQKSMNDVKLDAAQSAVSLMASMAGDNKAALIAVMVAEKALAIARIMMNTEVAASAAMASAAMLGPAGVAIGTANASAIRAMSYVSIGMVAASGIMEGISISGKRALGGPVIAGQTYIVNENRAQQGPEYFTPGVSGTITPANRMGGVTLNQNITIDARGADVGSEQRINAAMKRNKEETKAEIMNSMNRGGSFALASGRR